jgi:vacuolar-type H+-ATPase subunit H
MREGEKMSLEAIRKVTEVEKQMLERKSAAEMEARQILSDAENQGARLLQQVREEALEEGRAALKEAEKCAETKAAEIQKLVLTESNELRIAAEKHLDEAVEFIVGRVVNQ